MKPNIKKKIFTDSMSDDSNKSKNEIDFHNDDNEKQIKEKLIKDKTLLNIFFNSNKNDPQKKIEENSLRFNINSQDDLDIEIINKIINIDEAALCEHCKVIVRQNDKETICRESSIFKSKPNKCYNCYNLTPENTCSEFIIPSMNQFKQIKKFEVSKTKKTRKMDRDCIHKKIKARLFKFVKDKMKVLILPELSNLKIPQNIISDVTFNFNKDLLNRTIQSIFVERYFYFNSTKNLQKICLEGKLVELNNFLQRSVRDCFEEYLSSDIFEKDIKKFQNESYISTFKDYSFGFIEYYNQPPNYKRMKRKNNDSSDSKSES
jgi:hypothetical protein